MILERPENTLKNLDKRKSSIFENNSELTANSGVFDKIQYQVGV